MKGERETRREEKREEERRERVRILLVLLIGFFPEEEIEKGAGAEETGGEGFGNCPEFLNGSLLVLLDS